MSTKILDRVDNVMGSWPSVGAPPDAGTKTATVVANLASGEQTNTSNWLRLLVYADFGQGRKFMLRGPDWNGGPNAPVPSLTWSFPPSNPPALVYAELENGIRGAGSEVDVSNITISFS